MFTDTVPFTAQILNSYSHLQDFLTGKSVEKRIEQQVVKADTRPNLLGRWNVIPLALTEPIMASSAAYLRAIGSSLSVMGFQDLSMRLQVRSELLLCDDRLNGYLAFGDNYLAPSLNVYAEQDSDLYLHPALPVKEITSAQVRQIISPLRDHLEFQDNDGCCRGDSTWFIYLYHKTRHSFHNHRDQMLAIGRQFSNGAPREAALLQSLCPKLRLLNLREVSQEIIKTETVAKKNMQIGRFFQKLRSGSYLVGVPEHCMSYIAVSEQEGYLFDPNLGTAAITSKEDFDQLGRIIFEYSGDETPEEREVFGRVTRVEPSSQ